MYRGLRESSWAGLWAGFSRDRSVAPAVVAGCGVTGLSAWSVWLVVQPVAVMVSISRSSSSSWGNASGAAAADFLGTDLPEGGWAGGGSDTDGVAACGAAAAGVGAGFAAVFPRREFRGVFRAAVFVVAPLDPRPPDVGVAISNICCSASSDSSGSSLRLPIVGLTVTARLYSRPNLLLRAMQITP